MCGIVGYTGCEKAAPVLFGGLGKLEYRGYDSSGIATIADNKIYCVKTKGRVKDLILKSKNGALLPGNTGIGHTRRASPSACEQCRPYRCGLSTRRNVPAPRPFLWPYRC